MKSYLKPSSLHIRSISFANLSLALDVASSLLEQSIRVVLRGLASGSESLIDRFTELGPENQQLLPRYIGKEINKSRSKEN